MKEDFILEEEIEFYFDGRLHLYDCKCYDGRAYCTLIENDDSFAPKEVELIYPKLKDVLSDEDKVREVLEYRGLYDLTDKDIHYGDIMMCYGETL